MPAPRCCQRWVRQAYPGCHYQVRHSKCRTGSSGERQIEGLIFRGCNRINLKDYEGAVTDFDNAIKIDPKNVIAYMNRGTARGAQKKYRSALEDLDMAAKLKFDYSAVYINRALVRYVSGDKKGACKDLEKADNLNDAKAGSLIDQYCRDMK